MCRRLLGSSAKSGRIFARFFIFHFFCLCRFVFLTRHTLKFASGQCSRVVFFSVFCSCFSFRFFPISPLWIFIVLKFCIQHFNRPSTLYRRLSIRYSIVIIIYIRIRLKNCCHNSITDWKRKVNQETNSFVDLFMPISFVIAVH